MQLLDHRLSKCSISIVQMLITLMTEEFMPEMEQFERETWTFIKNSTPWLSNAKVYREELFLALKSASQKGVMKDLAIFQDDSTASESDILFLENPVKIRMQLLPTTEGFVIKIAFHSSAESGNTLPPFYVVHVIEGHFLDSRGRYFTKGLEHSAQMALAFAYHSYCKEYLQPPQK